MKPFIITLFALAANIAYGQTAADYAVQLEAKVEQSPARITLTWKPLPNTLSYKIYKKSKEANDWGSTPIVSLTTADTSYIDNNVVADSAYEYQVIKQGNTITATGYIYAGVRAPAIHNRGAILLLVDSTFKTPCQTELTRLMTDIRGDGWQVLREDVPRTMGAQDVRNIIQARYQANGNLKAVLILGHVAVPYSGEINPDGHNDHKGAWAADVYYADVNDTWTDATVNNTSATRPENDNTPGDGKWDQSTIPGQLELQVGRIDFANMPAFVKTEVQLMKSYLDRDHAYKMNTLNMVKRALIDDNFPVAGQPEAFASNGWRNFNPMVGRDSIVEKDLISTLNTSAYQWAYGCGPGGSNGSSATGIGTTANFSANDVNGIFTFLFGSYFGDFDFTNCLLRAPLCAPTPALISSWAGRPSQFLHHMALGEHIGYSSLLSQNSDGSLYSPVSFANRMVHQALMGDLTLRTDYIKPAGKPVINSSAATGTVITWASSPEAGVIGYYVYRAESEFGWYTKRSGLITGNSFTDSLGTEGTKYYMVRPAMLQSTPSGNYENLGIGDVETGYAYYFGFDVDVPVLHLTEPKVHVYPNPSSGALSISILSQSSSDAYISVTDQTGRKVYGMRALLLVGSNHLSPDVSHLPSGVYMITIDTGSGITTEKWVKKQ